MRKLIGSIWIDATSRAAGMLDTGTAINPRMCARIAVFTLVEWSLSTIREWADAEGHEIAILITQPPAVNRPGLRDLTAAGPEAITLAVPEVAECRTTLADVGVDLGVVFTFRRVPETVASIPRLGTVNVHPSLLPAYRGANGYRALFEGAPRIGATLHHLTPIFDAGAILAQASEPTPDDVEPSIALDALKRGASEVLRIGVARALAGDRGEPQDDAAASAAPLFTEADLDLSLDTSSHMLQCRFSALTLSGRQPVIRFDGAPHPLQAVRLLPTITAPEPGVIALNSRRAIAATRDGVVELALGKRPF